MSLPRSVAEVLSKHVTLELEGIDRMYLNVFVPQLQYEGGVASFFKFHRGHQFASSALMMPTCVPKFENCFRHTSQGPREDMAGAHPPASVRESAVLCRYTEWRGFETTSIRIRHGHNGPKVPASKGEPFRAKGQLSV